MRQSLNLLSIEQIRANIPQQKGKAITWSNLSGDCRSLAIAQAALHHPQPIIVITADNLLANQLEEEISFFLNGTLDTPTIQQFPDWETLPYDQFSPHQDIISQRLKVLHDLPLHQRGITIIPIASLMHRVAPQHYIAGNVLSFKVGDELDLHSFRQNLQQNGYRHVGQVMEHGEFSIRGSIIDLYPMGCELPLRLDLFDNEIETIAQFDPENQRSLDKQQAVELLPAHEFPFDDNGITRFRQQWRDNFSGNPTQCPIYEAISEGIVPAGIEYYLPLFFKETATLFDYLPSNSCIIRVGDCHQATEQFWQETKERFEQRSYDITQPILAPPKLFLQANEVFQQCNNFGQIIIETKETEIASDHVSFTCQPAPELIINSRATEPMVKVLKFIEETAQRILFCAESAGRREVLLDMLNQRHINVETIHSWPQFIDGKMSLAIIDGPLNQGLILDKQSIAVITESQLFGQHVIQRRQKKQTRFDSGALIKSLAELKVGDPVVHLNYGVGRYQGLQHIGEGEDRGEYLVLEYTNQDKIFVPVTSLDVISRYSGGDLEYAPLHSLGTNKWSREKQKAAEKIRDTAAELLDIYARREAAKGYQFKLDNIDYHNFTSKFPFEETPDQTQAIAAIMKDMGETRLMDRLICGDVGFGKTEVAMRAAFIAVMNGKQVAILVPTTLLASQHYNSFCDRFADFPVKVDWLSRMRTAKEQKSVVDKLLLGSVDIIIGTHKLLQKTIQYKNLGLLIIDEEHRFGVRQKETLKERRSEIDILSLTATPIPRTLNMAMSQIRDISIISTPPARRLSVKTFIQLRNDQVIREAILREIMRGGQVFFLHNKVETIELTIEKLQKLVPEAKFQFAHGQMRERQLEKVMIDFYHHRFHVLVCTTIIENGIDVPSANTIIIDRADHFGLAQLHQLRGRVGRSHHQAYAYLMTPDKKAMTSDAIKRLEAIASMGDLGAGFILASHDLEIRGAGELLGDQQSGSMHAIGFNLYMDLLERAVKALKSGKQPELSLSLEQSIEIKLNLPALIPDDFIPDIQLRLSFYKRIANAEDKTTLHELQVEMIERFGLLPKEVKYLLRITEIKHLAQQLKIEKITADSEGGKLVFNAKPNIDPATIIRLIQMHPAKYKLAGNDQLRFVIGSESADERLDVVFGVLQKLASSKVGVE